MDADATAAHKPAVTMSIEPRINLFMRGILSRLPDLKEHWTEADRPYSPRVLGRCGNLHTDGKGDAFLLKLAAPNA
jgi:hypothetical protein